MKFQYLQLKCECLEQGRGFISSQLFPRQPNENNELLFSAGKKQLFMFFSCIFILLHIPKLKNPIGAGWHKHADFVHFGRRVH